MNEWLLLLGSVAIIAFVLLITWYDKYLTEKIRQHEAKHKETNYDRKNKKK